MSTEREISFSSMNKKFRCGRVILTKGGILEKLELGDGGGCRNCVLDHRDMTFDEVHHRLLDLFQLRTTLYDFQGRPIDVQRYSTFREYIDEHGLNGNSSAVFLGTREVDGIDRPRISMANRRKPYAMKTSRSTTFKKKTFTQGETNSSRTSTEYSDVVRNESSFNHQQSQGSSLEYSFKTSCDDIMKCIRDLINQNSFDQVFIQLHEYICTLHGYVSLTIDPLKQQMEQSNQHFQSTNPSEITLYSISLNNVYDLCLSIKTLLALNKNKFAHIQLFSTIIDSFAIFFDNLKSLQVQWLQKFTSNNNQFNSTSILPSFTSSSIESTSEKPRPLSPVLPLASTRQSSSEVTNQPIFFYQPVLNCLHDLLNVLSPEHLSPFRKMVKSSIENVESLRASINLNDELSICHGKRVLLSIRDKFSEKIKELYRILLKCDLDWQLIKLCKNILSEIRHLSAHLDRYQTQIYQNNHRDDSYRSSPPYLVID